MSIFDFFRAKRVPSSAETAKERLQIVLSHERISRDGDDFLPRLQRELLVVIGRYVDVDASKVALNLDRGDDISTLEIDIELPERSDRARRAATVGQASRVT